jgi:uncharacterized protein
MSEAPRRVLVWDAPNMDRCLAEVLGRSASPDIRPRMDALLRWFVDRPASPGRIEAAVFATVAPGVEVPLARWVANLRQFGWAVFVKPRRQRGDGVADELLRHVERAFRQGDLAELVVASHDADALGGSLRRWAGAGVAVTVLGYRERLPDGLAAEALEIDGLTFTDLELIPGVFTAPLPRTNLFDLPAGGRWFPPLQQAPAARVPGPAAEPRRADVVDFVRQVLAERGPDGVTLHEAGERLRDHFPGFSLERSGYGSVTELLEELRADGEVRITRSDQGHVLQAVSAGQPDPGTDVDAPVDDGGVDDTVIDLTDPEPAPAAGAEAEAEAATGGANPIYRLFGFGPDGTS